MKTPMKTHAGMLTNANIADPIVACARLTPPHPRRVALHGPTGLTMRCERCGALLTAPERQQAA
jgi:hypothetical protein